MKTCFTLATLVCLLLANSLMAFVSSETTSNDTLVSRPIYNQFREFSSYLDMQKFIHGQSNIAGRANPMYLHSISHDLQFFDDPAPRHFRLTGDHLWNLNAYNIGIGINPAAYNADALVNFFISGRIAFPRSNTGFILREPGADNHAKINVLYGAEGEAEFKQIFKGGNFFAGIGLSRLSAQEYQNNVLSPIPNTGSIIDPFLGFRYSFFPEGAETKIGLQAKLGTLYTSGVSNIDNNASPLYFGIGAHITSMQSFSRSSSASWMSLESGIFYSPIAHTLFGQFTIPVKLMSNFSIGLYGQVGSGLRNSIYNNLRTHTLLGIGSDIRFFSDQTHQLLNPYLGFLYQTHGYNLDDGYTYNGLPIVKIGNKFRLGQQSRWFFDLNVNAPVSAPETFIEQQPPATNIDQPFVFDVNLGLVYKIGADKPRSSRSYKGIIEIYGDDDIRNIGPSRFDPLDPSAQADQLMEKHIYVRPAKPADAIPVSTLPNIDASDLKLLRFTYEAQTRLDRMSHRFLELNQTPKDSIVLLLVMFDKERTNINQIDNTNMSLVFSDLGRSRYFGFRHDLNQRLQPETRENLPLKVTGSNPYYGHYEEFVKPLRWLDTDQLALNESSINGKHVERDIFRYFEEFNDYLKRESEAIDQDPYLVTQSEYRFAYALFPQELFKRIQASTRDYGVSVMFNYDTNVSGGSIKGSGMLDRFINNDDDYMIDKNISYYFSNVIHGSEIYAPEFETGSARETERLSCEDEITLDSFGLGQDALSYENMQKIYSAAQMSFHCPVTIISGYTDRVEFISSREFMNSLSDMTNDPIVQACFSLQEHLKALLIEWDQIKESEPTSMPPDSLTQKTLAWRRIRSVIKELAKWNIDIEPILVNPVGIIDNGSGQIHNPNARKVVIRFMN